MTMLGPAAAAVVENCETKGRDSRAGFRTFDFGEGFSVIRNTSINRDRIRGIHHRFC